MTDREKFQKTFNKLHASPEVMTEVAHMKDTNTGMTGKRRFMPKLAAVLATVGVIAGTGGVAYATDFGGIQRTVQVWMHGDQTEAVFSVENGTYSMEYTDKDGKESVVSGGGVGFEDDGTERPLTEEELLEEVNQPDVEYRDDGSVWIYCRDQKMEITEKFQDDVCYLQLQVDGKTQYVTIKYKDGYAISPHGYIQPDEFNVQ